MYVFYIATDVIINVMTYRSIQWNISWFLQIIDLFSKCLIRSLFISKQLSLNSSHSNDRSSLFVPQIQQGKPGSKILFSEEKLICGPFIGIPVEKFSENWFEDVFLGEDANRIGIYPCHLRKHFSKRILLNVRNYKC